LIAAGDLLAEKSELSVDGGQGAHRALGDRLKFGIALFRPQHALFE